MKNEPVTREQLEEAIMEQEDLESFKPKPVEQMDRKEKRSRKRYYEKELKKHELRKPTINLTLRKELGVLKKDVVKMGETRMKICQTCEHFNNTKKNCNLCGCHMPKKTLVETATCPDKRW